MSKYIKICQTLSKHDEIKQNKANCLNLHNKVSFTTCPQSSWSKNQNIFFSKLYLYFPAVPVFFPICLWPIEFLLIYAAIGQWVLRQFCHLGPQLSWQYFQVLESRSGRNWSLIATHRRPTHPRSSTWTQKTYWKKKNSSNGGT